MIRRPPRSTRKESSAASDVYKRQVQISCGESHAGFITQEGKIFTMGSNEDGRLGIGEPSIMMSTTPCLLSAVQVLHATSISCGSQHSAATFSNGSLYTWGCALHGALGLPGTVSQWAPVKTQLVTAKHVACGARHTMAVSGKGRVYACGTGDRGQLGTGGRECERTFVEVDVGCAVKEVVCGKFHTLAVNDAGKVFATGDNSQGQLGLNNRTDSLFFTQIESLATKCVVKVAASDFSACLDILGEVYVWGNGFFGNFSAPTAVKGFGRPIRQFGIGKHFGVFIDRASTMYSWGLNSNGELGLGDYDDRAEPAVIASIANKELFDVSCGPSYTIALSGNGRTSRENSLAERELFQPRSEDSRATKQTLSPPGNTESKAKPKRTPILENTSKENTIEDYKKLRAKMEGAEEHVIALKNEKHKRVLQRSDEHILLLNSERKLKREVEETESLLRPKLSEIEALDKEILQAKTLYESLSADQVFIPKQFNKEREELESKAKRQRELIEECKDRNARVSTAQREFHEELEDSIKSLKEELKNYDEDIEAQWQQAKVVRLSLKDTEENIKEAEKTYEKLLDELKHKSNALINEKEKHGRSAKIKEIQSLRESLSNQENDSKELLKAKDLIQIEADNLTSKVNEYKRLTERLKEGNSDLRRRIELLEENNKRLLTELNSLLFDRANEYKERTLNVLSVAPRRASTQEGLSRILEIKNLPKKVQNIVKDHEEEKLDYGRSNFELVKRLDEYNPPNEKKAKPRTETMKEWRRVQSGRRPMSDIEAEIAESKERLMKIFNSPPKVFSPSAETSKYAKRYEMPLTARHERSITTEFPSHKSAKAKH
eukprot:TRINITY_DN2548_c0_g1_i3.p1 TRINITY_DN2548_c0_g1~~TRINITY_DN2548_c0_g1_i3.p1  ORF type:complete len:846 (-),score=231.03 TRINITY_DN2548_c0_g1_i3:90-2597(-)